MQKHYTNFIHKLTHIDTKAFRLLCLISAVLLYAVAGSPTPDAPGLIEAAIALLLMISIGFGPALRSLNIKSSACFWQGSGKLLLYFGLIVAPAVGVLQGNPQGLILRDVIPFLFMLLPVFLYHLFEERQHYASYYLAAVLAAGFIFALRAVLDVPMFNPLGEELFYFANAPTVLFACLFLTGSAGYLFSQGLNLKDLGSSIVLALLSLLPILAMILSAQRATLGALVLYIGALFLIALVCAPRRLPLLMLILGGLFILSFPYVEEVWRLLSQKTVAVGLNMRTQEAMAVWDEVSRNPGTLFLGLGWGGTFHSPAVGNLSVNYTHGLMTSMLLKTGIAGIFLTFIYMAGLLGWLFRLSSRNPVLGLALAAPILIDMFFYASFKSLDFGLVLLLIPAFLLYTRTYKSARESLLE